MDEQERPKSRHDKGALIHPDAAEQREVPRCWQQPTSGLECVWSGLPVQPDDPVAYKLLDAAGDAIGKATWSGVQEKGINGIGGDSNSWYCKGLTP
jgi:hypothetical protein